MVYPYHSEIQERVHTSSYRSFYNTDTGNFDASYDAGGRG